MRIISSLLAACLSFLTISSSFSAPSCDLSCSLRRAYFHCHTAASNPGTDPAMSMPTGMDMDSGSAMSEPVAAQIGHAKSDHLMSRDMNMAMKPVDETAEPEASTGASDDPFQIDSSCAHEACGQTVTSDSAPNPGPSQPASRCFVTFNLNGIAAIQAGFQRESCPATPPDTIPAIEPLAAPLRI